MAFNYGSKVSCALEKFKPFLEVSAVTASTIRVESERILDFPRLDHPYLHSSITRNAWVNRRRLGAQPPLPARCVPASG